MSGIQMIMAAGGGGSPYWYGRLSRQSTTRMLTDDAGNIYFSGYYTYDGTYNWVRNFIYKFDKNKNLLWGKWYQIGSSNRTYGGRTALDSKSNPQYIYLMGDNSSVNYGVLFKVSVADGTVAWAKKYSGSNSWGSNDVCVAGGNVYIVGTHTSVAWIMSFNASTGNTTATAQYQWNNRNQGSAALACAPASNGDVFVLAYGESAQNCIWARFTSSLSNTWKYITGFNVYNSGLSGMVSDASDNFYFNQKFRDSNGWDYQRIVKVNSSGTFVWAKIPSLPNAGNYGLTNNGLQPSVDSSGNVYWAASSNFGSTLNVGYMIKWDSSGNTLFSRNFSPPSTSTFIDYGLITPVNATDILQGWSAGSSGAGFPLFYIPGDGTKTGTYTIGGVSYTYGSSSVGASSTTTSTSSASLWTTYTGASFSINAETANTGALSTSLSPTPIP